MVLIDDTAAEHGRIMERLRKEPGFRVLASVTDVEAALEVVQRTRPDLVLLNLRQEGDDSLTVAGALHGEVPETRVIMLGLGTNEADVASLVRAGVSGFVMAGASFEECLGTIRSVAAGVQVLPIELTRSLFGQLGRHTIRNRPQRTLEIDQLTVRERQVADLIAQGCSNKAIATRLHITVHTVKCHVHNVLSKLALNSRLEVAALSHQAQSGTGSRRLALVRD
jgi:two-component system nitrate/nitrite response regulator NarL